MITCELLGFVVGCATLAASHKTDYVVGYGTAFGVALHRTDRLLELAVKSGYMEELAESEWVNGEPTYKIVDDPKFLHMLLKAEEEWMAQRKADISNPALMVPVRLRDGDACRYCGVVVVRGGDKKSDRYATYDHREPGQPGTVATLVVCCNGCNKMRGDKADADDRHPLMPPPPDPYYSKETLNYLANNRRHVPPHVQVQLNLRPAEDTSDPAPSRAARTATPQPAGQRDRLDTSSAPAEGTRSADPADRRSPGSGFTGSGRVGTGRAPDGSRSDLDGTAGPRSRRGRRRRPR
ncbi:MAG TPA: hypothetical protein VJ851_00755 [Jatrophihabitans sp.]|nr:hypothetical protein [Jatrophihabitans sp.]